MITTDAILPGEYREYHDEIIRIRPHRDEDAAPQYSAVVESVEQLVPWMPWCHADYSLQDCGRFIESCFDDWEKDRHYAFAIIEAASGRYLGTVGLNLINREHKLANVGYWIRTGSTRRGLAGRAVRLISRFGFEQLGFQRLEILVATHNLRSQRVAEKVGATREGVLRHRILLRGQCHDAVLYSLLPGDLSPS